MDFIRGAALAEEGRAIIALPVDRGAGGSSRIVADAPAGRRRGHHARARADRGHRVRRRRAARPQHRRAGARAHRHRRAASSATSWRRTPAAFTFSTEAAAARESARRRTGPPRSRWCRRAASRWRGRCGSPSPEPCALVVKNGSKMRVAQLGGTPGPVVVDGELHRRSFDRAAAMRHRTALGRVASSALRARFIDHLAQCGRRRRATGGSALEVALDRDAAARRPRVSQQVEHAAEQRADVDGVAPGARAGPRELEEVFEQVVEPLGSRRAPGERLEQRRRGISRGSRWMRRSSTDSCSAAALSGFLISCERPAVMVPTAASFSAICARRASSRFSPASRDLAQRLLDGEQQLGRGAGLDEVGEGARAHRGRGRLDAWRSRSAGPPAASGADARAARARARCPSPSGSRRSTSATSKPSRGLRARGADGSRSRRRDPASSRISVRLSTRARVVVDDEHARASPASGCALAWSALHRGQQLARVEGLGEHGLGLRGGGSASGKPVTTKIGSPGNLSASRRIASPSRAAGQRAGRPARRTGRTPPEPLRLQHRAGGERR